MVRLGTDCLFRYVNPAFAQVAGPSAAVVHGRTCAELGFPESFCTSWDRASRSVIDSARESRVELEWRMHGASRWFGVRIMPEASDGRLTDSILAVAGGHRPEFGLEYACQGPGGERWFEMRVTPFRGEGPARVGVAHEEITDRRRAEEARRVSEARYRELVEHSRDGVLLGTPGGGIHQANPAACALLGYPEEELRVLGRDAVVDSTDDRLGEALAQRGRTGRFQPGRAARARHGPGAGDAQAREACGRRPGRRAGDGELLKELLGFGSRRVPIRTG